MRDRTSKPEPAPNERQVLEAAREYAIWAAVWDDTPAERFSEAALAATVLSACDPSRKNRLRCDHKALQEQLASRLRSDESLRRKLYDEQAREINECRERVAVAHKEAIDG